ncbi:MAG: DciA family protein [Propionibacteriaceae bacterium]|nr:DciA family protein [Propionibacteriaceae bacterium]
MSNAPHDPTGLDAALAIVAGMTSTPLPEPSVKPKRLRRPRTARAAGQLESLGDVLPRVIEEQGWSTQLSVAGMLGHWEALVGATNAAHSTPEAFRDGVLRVRAESTTWATALRTIAPQVIAKLNEHIGDGTVTRMDVVGPNAPSWKSGRLSVRNGRGPRDTYG